MDAGRWTLDKSTYLDTESGALLPHSCMSGSGIAGQQQVDPTHPTMCCWLWHCPHRSHRIAIRIRKQPTANVALGESLQKAAISTC